MAPPAPLPLAGLDIVGGGGGGCSERAVASFGSGASRRARQRILGRVAMAAFLGDCVQCVGVVKGEHKFLLYCGYVADVSPQEQWDNIPVIGKLQILTFVGMLESHDEILLGQLPWFFGDMTSHVTSSILC